MHVMLIVVQVLSMISGLALIGLVAAQTTKSEGLTGTIGGKMSSSFRGKPGMDEKLAELTKWSAIAFMAFVVIAYVLSAKGGA